VEKPPPERANYKTTFAVVLLGVTAYGLLLSMVFPALPEIQRDLGISESTATWVLTIYLLSASIFTPILGRVGDKVGKERMLVVALGALAVGSVVAGLSRSIDVLLLGRFIQGMGGGVVPLAFGIIRDEFPAERVGFAVGLSSALLAVGSGIGTLVAGPIVNHLNFHFLFWIPLAMVIPAAIMAHLFVPESPVRTEGRISWTAALLLSAWLVALLVGVSEAPSWGWGSPKVLSLFVLAAALIVSWLVFEWRSDHPLIDMQMMRTKAVWTTNLAAFLIGIGMYSSAVILPELIQTPAASGYGFGASILTSSLYLLPQTALMFVFGLWSGSISNRIGSKTTLVIGISFSTVGYAMLAAFHAHPGEIIVAGGLLGVGFGLAFSALAHLIVQAVPDTQTGVASGMNANIRTIGGAIGSAVVASVLASVVLGSGLPKEVGYTWSFGFMALCAGCGVLTAAFLVPTPDHDFVDEHVHQIHAEIAMVPGATIVEQ
jgi:EmrB/QacA subfamily drug resistance transporter